MEFTIACPVDGSIEVGLEDIDNVVLREADRADITFVCPHCGTEITVSAVVPSFLLAAIEALAEDTDTTSGAGTVGFVGEDVAEAAAALAEPKTIVEIAEDDPSVNAYCEYFHRQLDGIRSVDDLLKEIDARG